MAPLRAIKDNHPKTVILLNGHGTTVTRDGIIEMSVTDFLLGERSD